MPVIDIANMGPEEARQRLINNEISYDDFARVSGIQQKPAGEYAGSPGMAPGGPVVATPQREDLLARPPPEPSMAEQLTRSYARPSATPPETPAGPTAQQAPGGAPVFPFQKSANENVGASALPTRLPGFTQPVAAPVIPTDYSGFQAAHEEGLQANERQKQAIASSAQQQDAALAKFHQDYANVQAIHRQADVNAQAELGAHRQKIAGLVDGIRKQEIDPDRYVRNMGGWQKALALVAIGLGGFNEGFKGIPNQAMKTLQDSIAKDIEAQKDEFAAKKAGLDYENNLYAQNMQAHQDERAARLYTEADMYKMFSNDLDMLKEHAKDAKDAAAIDAAQAPFEEKYELTMAAAHQETKRVHVAKLEKEAAATLVPFKANVQAMLDRNFKEPPKPVAHAAAKPGIAKAPAPPPSNVRDFEVYKPKDGKLYHIEGDKWAIQESGQDDPHPVGRLVIPNPDGSGYVKTREAVALPQKEGAGKGKGESSRVVRPVVAAQAFLEAVHKAQEQSKDWHPNLGFLSDEAHAEAAHTMHDIVNLAKQAGVENIQEMVPEHFNPAELQGPAGKVLLKSLEGEANRAIHRAQEVRSLSKGGHESEGGGEGGEP